MAEDIGGSSRGQASSFNWGKALMAGLVATVIITISMALFGMNIMKSLGQMVLGPQSGASTQYLVGGLMHLMVGVGYGLLYSAVVAPVRRWPAVMKGLVFGLSITAIALAAMPIMAAVMSRGGTSNPCNPCSGVAGAQPRNPCNPCAGKTGNQAGQQSKPTNPCNPCAAKNPCNPCAAKNANSGSSAPNACNPCGTKKEAPSSGNPCSVAAAGNPCNPCGGGGGSPYSGLISLINHVIFGLALAFAYGRGGAS